MPAYGLLAYLIMWGLRRSDWSLSASIATGLGVTCLFGLYTELLQSHVPGREASLADLLSDATGAVVASSLLLIQAWAIWPRRSRSRRGGPARPVHGKDCGPDEPNVSRTPRPPGEFLRCPVYYSNGRFQTIGVAEDFNSSGGRIRGKELVTVDMELVVIIIQPTPEIPILIRRASVRWVRGSDFPGSRFLRYLPKRRTN
ncbi:MAG: VanZ family protein [Nitrospiraceae bacterium]